MPLPQFIYPIKYNTTKNSILKKTVIKICNNARSIYTYLRLFHIVNKYRNVLFSKSLQILIQNDVLVYSLAEVHQDLETYYKELYKG